MAIPKNLEQIVLHMRKRMQKAVIVRTPPIPLYWNGIVGADLVVGRHWFACGGTISKIFVSVSGEIKKDNPAILRFEFSSGTTGRYYTHTFKDKEVSTKIEIIVNEGEHLIIRASSEDLIAVETAVLFLPDANVIATAKAFYDEIERLDNEGNGDSITKQSESGTEAGQSQQGELSGPNNLLESTGVGRRTRTNKSNNKSGS